MLEWILIRGFQKHTHLKVEFGPGLTTLVGPTDRGKSSVLRALAWVFFNRPAGTSFITNGVEEARVTLKLDGTRVTRRRSRGGVNTYSLGVKKFTALGRGGVPPGVEEFLNISPSSVQGQHDPPFWLSLPPGGVSRELNQIINLDLIDHSLSSLASSLRTSTNRVEVSSSRLKESQEARDSLLWCREANTEFSNLESRRATARETASLTVVLNETLKRVLPPYRALGTLEEAKTTALVLTGRVRALQDSRVGTRELHSLLHSLSKNQVLEGSQPPEEDLTNLGLTLQCLTSRKKETRALRALLKRALEFREEACKKEDTARAAVRELDKKAGGKCPLCGAPSPGT